MKKGRYNGKIVIRNILLILLVPTAIFLWSWSAAGAQERSTLRLATTTSTDNSGLLKTLLPPFERKYGFRVHVVAVGTGKALRMGRDGDADVILVHAYEDEIQFVNSGYGVHRRDVMYNDFVVVGPASDPADIRGLNDAAEAFSRIYRHQGLFVSRGDESGTHKREKQLWKNTGLTPSGTWYREAGQGMGKVLHMADELDAYTLTDRGTWLAHKARLPHLQLLVEGDERLFNRYGVIAVNPGRFPESNYVAATAFIDWITSHEGQEIISNFTINDQALFTPAAKAQESRD